MAQAQDKQFINISVDKGLSQSTVYSIMQDKLGFIWMGTQDGLNRYDGHGFTVYRPVKNDPKSVSSFYIRCLFNDKDGRMWVGGNAGIDAYDYLTNSFQKFSISPGPGEWYIAAIVQDAEGRIWAASNAGELYQSDAERKNFTKILSANTAGVSEIYSLAFVNKKLVLGTLKGLLLFDTQTKNTERVNAANLNSRINYLYKDGAEIWIGTEGEGLLKWNTANGSFTNYKHQPAGIANNSVRSIEKDAGGNLWIGTFTGLSIMSPSGVFQNYFHQPQNNFTIGQNSVRCIYRDHQNGIWLGTYYGGISYYHQQLITFNSLSQNSVAARLNTDVVNVIEQDQSGNFYIGTESGGLNYWQPAQKQMRYFTGSESGGTLNSNNIKSIAIANDGSLFLGTHNAGLNILNPASGAVKIFKNTPGAAGTISGDMVYALTKDHNGQIWVGTRTGLDLYNAASQTFTPFAADKAGKPISSSLITYLMEDSKNRLWIGTINGVNILNAGTGLFENISNSSLSNDVVNFIAEDNKKRIWIGTRDGLNLYDEKEKKFINYNERTDFLKGNINSILTDGEDNLWISTNTSLVKFNADKKSTVYYDKKDGMLNNQFNVYASCAASDGRLLFGGLNGITYFYPKSLAQQPLALKVSLTGLEVLNQTIAPGDGSGILKNHINSANELHFANDHKQFTIFFNTFNYISDNSTQYFYKLDGFDDDWRKAEGAPRATYTNLQPGSYKFHVKAIGPQGEVSDERTLKISVSPVWYKSTWFYLLLALAIITAAIFLYRILTERLRTMNQLKMERVQREKANYINKVKMDFFTNVSHELRTPLTLIMAPLEEILKHPQPDKKLRRQHELMMRNTRRLYNIVNQLFEFKKTELGIRKLKVAKTDLVKFVKNIYQSFKPLAEKKQINYEFTSSVDELILFYDRDAIENILFNLLSNAFKYTGTGQSITVSLSASRKNAIIEVADTGIGMDAQHLPKIFDRYYQVDSQETNLGSGVGLSFTKQLVALHHGSIDVKSEPGKGTGFTVLLPLADGAYDKDSKTDTLKIPDADNVENEPDDTIDITDIEEEITAPEGEMETLMFVDDNREIIDFVKEYFSKNYKVITAYDGKEGLAILENEQPDLIVSDVMMPELDGLHFCKRVKQNIQTSHIPVMLLTAKSDESQQLKGFEMGADDYIVKPFSIAILEAKIQGILRARKKLREYYASGKEVEPEKLTFNTLDEEFLKNAVSLVEENLDEYDFSVEKLSRDLNMSRSNLYLKLKAITGESVTTFIKRIRLNKSVKLLEEGRHTISEIAYMCGFNTPSYFSTTFKQFYGYMPSEYLDIERKNKK